MKVEVFVSAACSHRDRTLDVVDEAITESGSAAERAEILVADYEDAKARRCFGSPTIRVDGVDVEYAEREPEEFTTGCRFYNNPEGWVPYPRKELVVRGIQAAKQRSEARAKQ